MEERRKVWWRCTLCKTLNATEIDDQHPTCTRCRGVYEWDDVVLYYGASTETLGSFYEKAVREGDTYTASNIVAAAKNDPVLAWVIVEVGQALGEPAFPRLP